MHRVFAFIFLVSLCGVLLLPFFDVPVRAQGPVENAQATIWAATREVQMTRDAREAEMQAQRATATRLWVMQQEQAATATAVAATEIHIAKTATAQARATATAQAQASQTVQAQIAATAQAEQTALANVQATQVAQATATQAAYDSKELEIQLQTRQATLFVSAFLLSGTVSILLALFAIQLYQTLREQRRAVRPVVVIEPLTTDTAPRVTRAEPATASPDLEILLPFAPASKPVADLPLAVITELPEQLKAEIYEALQHARHFDYPPALPGA